MPEQNSYIRLSVPLLSLFQPFQLLPLSAWLPYTVSMTDIRKLIEVMAPLRHRENSCTWYVEQTFSAIAPYTIEEAFEVLGTIEREDLDGLRDELGNLLLQIVFHARVAQEISAFGLSDVVKSIVYKMIRRHPAVFGKGGNPANKAVYTDTPELKLAWEKIKSEEPVQLNPHDAS